MHTKKPRTYFKQAKLDEVNRPKIRSSEPKAESNQHDLPDLLRPEPGKKPELRLFEAAVPKDPKTSEAAIAIASLKIVADIHLERGSIDRTIDVSPQHFPLKRYDPLRKVLETDEATLHIANDLLSGDTVLIRTRKQVLSDEEKPRFTMQAADWQKFVHNGVLPVQDFGITNGGNPYQSFEYTGGCTLRSYLERNAPVDEIVIVNIFTEICNIVCAAHESDAYLRGLELDEVILSTTIFGSTALKISALGCDRTQPEQSTQEAESQTRMPWKTDVLAIVRSLREAIELNCNPGSNKKAISSFIEDTGPLYEELKNIEARTHVRVGAEKIDTVLKLKHELQGLRELLTYLRPRSVEKKEQAYDRKAIFTLAAMVPILVTAAAPLWLVVKPLELDKINDEFITSSTDAVGAYETPAPLPKDAELVLSKSLITPYDVSAAIVPYGGRLTPQIEESVVNSGDDIFALTEPVPAPPDFAQSRLLRYVQFDDCRFTADALAPLAGATKFTSLTFNRCADISLMPLARALNDNPTFSRHLFNTLNFRQTPVTGKELASFCHSYKIENLEVSDCPFSDEDIEQLASIPFKRLTLNNTSVTKRGLEHISGRDLEELTLKGKIASQSDKLETLFPGTTIVIDK